MPNVQGGVETHAEELYGRLAPLGCDVEVIVRSPFVPARQKMFGPLRLTRIWSPRTSGLETLVHSFLGVLYAGFVRPDILHIHAVGPAIVTPIARMLGLRVVVTHHGPDYDRDKWGGFARWVLRVGESLGMRFASARIVISKVIAGLVRSKYGLGCDLIPNGVVLRDFPTRSECLVPFGLEPGRYFLQVSRIVPEKRQLDLIQAFAAMKSTAWKLALVGSGGTDDYTQRVEAAARTSGVVLTGFQSGAALQQLFGHAGAFVLPSSHEGLPIALLEALSYGLPSMASDIPANLEVELDPSSYFPLGDLAALTRKLEDFAKLPQDAADNRRRKQWVAQKYDWERVARQTLAVYERIKGS
jgi:glycosyltransferase involved in cell wall biosynthesis